MYFFAYTFVTHLATSYVQRGDVGWRGDGHVDLHTEVYLPFYLTRAGQMHFKRYTHKQMDEVGVDWLQIVYIRFLGSFHKYFYHGIAINIWTISYT